mmetsp:Transcript_5597/g.17901  ORF Transcript_5597/g.17901 Transcript_5597/m.17901 type:complete len:303 (-) Transcript_5597:517-1425(-)
MGQLLSLLGVGGDAALQLDAALPSSSGAKEAYDLAERALVQYEESFKYLERYQGNDALVRKAIGNPHDEEVRREAFRGMFPNVIAIRGFFELSQAIDEAVKAIVVELLNSPGEPQEVLQRHGALVRQLARIFESVFHFDWIKMSKPQLQNDFSFYRRELGKNSGVPDTPVEDSTASKISMFVAQANPLLFSIASMLTILAKSQPLLLELLCNFVNGCAATTRSKLDPVTQQTVQLAMVVGTVIYDRIGPTGAFARGTPIEVKRVVSNLRGWPNDQRDNALATLQYSSKNFNQAPNSVRRMFP